MFRKSMILCVAMLILVAGCHGCSTQVNPGRVGRVNTPSGWSEEILKPGYHTCYGADKMYLLDTTNKSFPEKLNILIGGKVNLRVDFMVRVRANTEDKEMMKKAFESVTAVKDADGYLISVDQLYTTFLQMKAQAIPRAVFEVQPDVATAVASSPKLAIEIRKQIMEAAKATPVVVEDVQIVNYDWPESITKAQEELVKIQLKEAAEEAQVRADLKRAEGDLKVKEAQKLVQLKEAESISESIAIIKKSLADAPEYLMWHQIKVMGQAAMGPNNCFILYPYATDSSQVRGMIGNANLTQMLHPEGPKPEMKKNPPPMAAIKD